MSHEHEDADLSQMFTREFWDGRYAESSRIWSGRPNARLVERASGLAPGDAVDVGCGEGADAVWLASRGWRVTGLDLSQAAVDRAAEHARQAGVADRATFRQHDLIADPAIPSADLVSAQFLHVPPDAFDAVYGALAAAVRPGGSLVVAGHHPADASTGLRNPQLTHLLFPPEQVTAVLSKDSTDEWDVLVADAPTRPHLDHDGNPVRDENGEPIVVTDTLVHAVRRP